MERRITSAEKQLIELRFALEEEEASRWRQFYRVVFWIGLPAALGTIVTHGLMRSGLLTALLTGIWALSVGVYTAGRTLATTFEKDSDLRWHLNPWRDALTELGREGRQTRAIVLLAALPLCRLIAKAIVLAMR